MTPALHTHMIQRCFELAQQGQGTTNPNPLVGSVVVKDGRIIGEGFHQIYGGPHAEVVALKNCTESPAQATLYCNLEPCCHTKKQTPPCTDLLIRSQIKKVIIANLDPNPQVAGQGVAILRAHGIEVEHGLLAEQGAELNRVFFKWITTGLPYLHLKMAQTLDGKIATTTGDARWISSGSLRQYAHELRAQYSAILVGLNTVLQDNPALTIRHNVKANHVPYRVVIGNPNRLSFQETIFTDDHKERTIILATQKLVTPPPTHFASTILEIGNYNTIPSWLKQLTTNFKITSLLVEGGAALATSLLKANLIDRATFITAPKLLGQGLAGIGNLGIMKMADAIEFDQLTTRLIDHHYILEGHPRIQ